LCSAELLDLPFPPPYLAPTTKGKAILQGVNYASGAGGYIRSTGFNFVSCPPSPLSRFLCCLSRMFEKKMMAMAMMATVMMVMVMVMVVVLVLVVVVVVMVMWW
jgi:hypothetical protein